MSESSSTAWTEGETICWELPLEEPQIDALIEVLVRRKLKPGSPLAEALKLFREIQLLYQKEAAPNAKGPQGGDLCGQSLARERM